ncbi:MAG: septum formation initiator family protein [Candidatus Margulisbacteria bacterium]|jgi:cell division protein DivIC|nr:septum formation initiator family protein [Candidatus Margulisiibacteriota bacterium]
MSATAGKRWLALFVAACVLYFGFELGRSYFRGQTFWRRYAALESRYAELLKQNQDLQIRLTEARSDAFIELNARDKLGLARPGETAYKIVEED